MVKEIKCRDCGIKLIEHSDFECYDEKDNDAEWDDTRKSWVCIDCWHELPDIVKK